MSGSAGPDKARRGACRGARPRLRYIAVYLLHRTAPYVYTRAARGLSPCRCRSIAGFSSVVTLAEVLRKPKQLGNRGIERGYRELLQRSRHFSLIPIDAGMADRAAELRARHQLRTLDALNSPRR